MNKDALNILEYEKILRRLSDCASTFHGKDLARNLLPADASDEIHQRLDETTEAVKISALAFPPFGGIVDIREILHKVALGRIADPTEVLDVLNTMLAMREIKKFFKESEVEAPLLKNRAASIEILGNLERQLDNAVDEHGAIRDDASVELQRIRRSLRTAQAKIKDQLSSILHNQSYQKFFQDALVTMRGDRYVIPIKAEYRREFPGLVHDQSSSSATVFIEPMAVVELNNDIRQLELDERAEVNRILRILSNAIQKNADVLLDNVSILAHIDFTFAKAKLAQSMRAIEPTINPDGRTILKSARHPLIDPASVVPIDLELGDRFRMLLITGPNTGGKTVSMKTLGLLALMAQSGLYIPAALGSELSIYRNIRADIGDEQSIEQSLSTFSAHMTKIVAIVDQVERGDLVLLDEIGAGTDPEEGAALAMSILEKLLAVGASTLATTHYSELKSFAYATDGIENACVEFDIETLKPTYRLLIGIPGASNAFSISQRLGLPESLIIRAKQLVTADHAKFEDIVGALENERLIYEQKNADMVERQQRIAQMERQVREMRDELNRTRGDIIRKTREKSSEMIRQTRRDAEEIIAALKEQFDDQGVKKRQQAIQDARDKIRAEELKAQPGILAQKVGRRINRREIAIGDTVYVGKLDQKGAVLSIEKDGREITVQIGALRTTVKIDDCRFISHGAQSDDQSVENQPRKKTSNALLAKMATVQRELDIRGLMVDESESVVGKFIDDATIAGLRHVLIIHGKGSGALRKGIHEFLRRNRSVASFQLADIDEGGSGATLVEIN